MSLRRDHFFYFGSFFSFSFTWGGMSLRRDHFLNFGSFFSFSFMWGGNHHPPCPSIDIWKYANYGGEARICEAGEERGNNNDHTPVP
jgi:hypothetical protein